MSSYQREPVISACPPARICWWWDYPPSGEYDECAPLPEHHARALKSIPKVPVPAKDPVYGAGGQLRDLWHV